LAVTARPLSTDSPPTPVGKAADYERASAHRARRLSVERLPAQECVAEREERLVHFPSPLIADLEPPESIEPGERPFHHPAIPPQPLARLGPAPRNPRGDATRPQCPSTARIVIPLVGMQFHGALAGRPRRRCARRSGRMASTVSSSSYESWTFAAEIVITSGRPIRSTTTCRLAPNFPRFVRSLPVALPPGVGTHALSSEARSQLMRPASCSRCKSAWCRRFQTPARCHSRKRRQQVMPLPQPISWGNIFQGMPLFKTKRIPVSAARSGMLRARPPLGLGRSGGRSSANTTHNSSPDQWLTHARNLPRGVRFC
jgi:hypothetical protein